MDTSDTNTGHQSAVDQVMPVDVQEALGRTTDLLLITLLPVLRCTAVPSTFEIVWLVAAGVNFYDCKHYPSPIPGINSLFPKWGYAAATTVISDEYRSRTENTGNTGNPVSV